MPINILRNRLAWMKAKHLMPIMRSNRFAIRRVFNSFYPYLNGSDVQNGRAGRRSSVIKIVDRVRVHDGRFVFLCRFTQILALGRQNKMTGAAEQYQYILRDESLHCNFGIDLINQIKLENPHLWTPHFRAEIRELFSQAVDLEYRYAED